MRCYLISHTANNPGGKLRKAAGWLSSIGGGFIVSDERRVLENALGIRGGAFDRRAKELSARGVQLTWRRRSIPAYGNVVAAFPSRALIEELEAKEQIDALLVLGWSENDWRDWAERRNPEILEM